MKLHYLSVVFLILIGFRCLADPAWQAGKDYRILSPATEQQANKKVIEFFNYGCPACFHLEPAVQQWLANKPKDVEFQRVPAVFHRGWESYAKAYYIIESLGLESRVGERLFAAIQTEQLDLSSSQALADFVAGQGVDKQRWLSAFDGSPVIDIKLKQGGELLQRFKILAVPSFVVNGRYYTDLRLAQGDTQRLIQLLDYLITQAND